MKFKLTKILNHYTLNQLVRLSQLDPNAYIEVNNGVAEQILIEIEAKHDRMSCHNRHNENEKEYLKTLTKKEKEDYLYLKDINELDTN